MKHKANSANGAVRVTDAMVYTAVMGMLMSDVGMPMMEADRAYRDWRRHVVWNYMMDLWDRDDKAKDGDDDAA